jgi:YD repeat-containing protein
MLLRPATASAQDHPIGASYKPRHKGAIHLGTGRYTREDEDLIVDGTPALILRRTYRSEYRIAREFGIGTTHNGGLLLEGDPERFQWVQIVLADGGRVRFERISSGTSYFNALFEHRSTPSEWNGARLGWTGNGWAVRRQDDTLMLFQGCGDGDNPVCWILSERDADGHRIDYRRDASGRLLRMEAGPDRWIAFDYDDQNRIARAYDPTGRDVRYDYDDRGRLARVRSSQGREDRYAYTARDQMSFIDMDVFSIKNTYDDAGRCVKQVNDYRTDAVEPYTFSFAYESSGDRIVRTETTRSDGSWTRYEYSPAQYIVEESWGSKGYQPLTFKYERDSITNTVTSVSLTCPDRTGRPVTHGAVAVRPDTEDWIKWDSVRTLCAWRADRWRLPE